MVDIGRERQGVGLVHLSRFKNTTLALRLRSYTHRDKDRSSNNELKPRSTEMGHKADS